MRHTIILSAALLVAACTAGDGNEYAAANESAVGMENGSTEIVPESETPPVEGNAGAEVPIPPDSAARPAGPPADDPSQCGADNYQWLVGESRSRIPEKPEGANWRIACTTCPVTMDYSPARMNIFYDEETAIIAEVKCG